MSRTEHAHKAEKKDRPVGEIRSFVLRQTRMTKHQQDAYARLYARYCVQKRVGVIPFRELFSYPERPLILEIGFGMGETTAAIAEAMPETNFVGVEVHKPGVGKLLGQIEKRSLENLRIVHDDVVPILRDNTGAESFDGIHIFFPDPWPKARHHKRRLIQPSFTSLLVEKLRCGGYLYVVTDWEEYAGQIAEVLGNEPRLRNRYAGFAPPQAWRPRTAFERKGLEKRHAVFELFVEREY